MYLQSEAQWKCSKSKKTAHNQAFNGSADKKENTGSMIRGVFPPYRLRESLYGNGAVVQRVRFSSTTWAPAGQVGQHAPFTDEQIGMIDKGLQIACAQLGKATGYLAGQLGKKGVTYQAGLGLVNGALGNVLAVLQNVNLTIFPLLDGSDCGQAAAGKMEISINISNHSDDNAVAKTLLHEAFHIIGGCTGTEYNDLKDRDSALGQIKMKRSIGGMNADSFAQFVMQC